MKKTLATVSFYITLILYFCLLYFKFKNGIPRDTEYSVFIILRLLLTVNICSVFFKMDMIHYIVWYYMYMHFSTFFE
ncbi:hypothetical protein EII29_02840 [Leptotrichia sp. OH3620_COT-345]|uniref:hypothetical protein n=1 Tax=Leptotrichia sp. OH3620_COT-345 TaxID=2491048 RepID=UPI000FA45092|nr:hypothetical protein [Leptotrichia sp. OH3620_COT-345]RRD40431.1 hypothetical protein EII29_02840 [Leptotrichia sp. OH3620_COT-345]